MKFSNWNLTTCSPSALKSILSCGVSPLAASVLAARGFDSPEKVGQFLDSEEHLLNDPFLMKDMDRAVARIRLSLERRERIAIYGDYDVDGITSTALLTRFLRSLGGNVLPYIPNRLEEGYGLNSDALEKLSRRGISLVVTVDCGITAVEEVAAAKEMGMDVVITDHHECKDVLPDAAAVVNPHRPDCDYPFKSLAGVGVALKLVLAMVDPYDRSLFFHEYADLAAIGTVADVMDLIGENRAIVQAGLDALRLPRRPGLKALLREAGLDGKPVTSTVIGFSLAPRLNASGRMGCAEVACELLLTENPFRGEELARELCTLNRDRQAIEMDIYNECIARLSRRSRKEFHSIVLADPNWHQGVVGIVASRLSEKFACPTFMICLSGGKGKGSCRSYGGINLFTALEHCSDLLETFGGHELAAGFTIREENIPAFEQRMEEHVKSSLGEAAPAVSLTIDCEISSPRLLTLENVDALSMMEPFGTGNPKPVFQLSGVTATSVSAVGGRRHTKFRAVKEDCVFDAIFFSTTPQDAGITPGCRLDLAFTPTINSFRGACSVQLQIVDVRPALTQSLSEQQLYRRYRQGEPLSPQEAALLTPSREDFVAVWRYLQRYAANCSVEDTAPRLCRKIARTFGIRETFTRTMVCLDVMDERGLITLSSHTDHLQIRLAAPMGHKVDLESSYIMKNLRRLCKE